MLSVIVPCYNEELNIPHIYEAFANCIGERNDIEVILVNNGSTDNSKEVFNEILKKDSKGFLRVVDVQQNKGYGHGILSGLKEARGRTFAWTHADLQTDPSDVLTAYDKYLSSNNPEIFIKGFRKEREFHAWFFSWMMQIISSILLKEKLQEINALPKVFSKNFYDKHLKDNAPHDFSLDLFAYYWAKKSCQIDEIPVVVRRRQFGEAKGGGSISTKIKLILRTFNYILQFRKQIKKQK